MFFLVALVWFVVQGWVFNNMFERVEGEVYSVMEVCVCVINEGFDFSGAWD